MPRRIKPLSKAEERALGLAVRSWVEYRDGLGPAPTRAESARLGELEEAGIRAQNRLVLSTLGVARKIAAADDRYSDADPSAIYAIGTLGLIHAAKKFDPDRGVKFVTYAYHWARRYLQLKARTVAPDRGEMRRHRMAITRHVEVSPYDDPVALDEAHASVLAARILAFPSLRPRQAEAIRLHYGIGCEPHSYRELGDMMGVTYQRAQQIVESAKRSIRLHAAITPSIRRNVEDYFNLEPGELALEVA